MTKRYLLIIPVLVALCAVFTMDIWAQNPSRFIDGGNVIRGWLRIGTGSTPGITVGADDAFIEGTLEVDGEAQFDGILDVNSTSDFADAAVFNSTVSFLGDPTWSSATSLKPLLSIINTNADANGSSIKFNKDSGSPADADVIGFLSWFADDSVGTSTELVRITGLSEEVADGDEAGTLRFQVMVDDGSPALDTFVDLTGDNASNGVAAIKFNPDNKDIDYSFGKNTSGNFLEYNSGTTIAASASTWNHTGGFDVTGGFSGSGSWTQDGGNVIFNNTHSDYDFSIFRNSTGAAYNYDAGNALHTFEDALQMGSSGTDTGTFTMIKGAQASDPQVQLALSADANGNFSITADTGDITLTAADDLFVSVDGASELGITGTLFYPVTTGGIQLGDDTYRFGSLFLDTSKKIDFGASDVTITHDGSSSLAIEGADIKYGSATTDTGTITMIKGAQASDPQVQLALSADANGDFSITADTGDITLTAADDFFVSVDGSVELGLTGAALYPFTSDGLTLGDATHMFSDAFLASGGVLNWGNGDTTITQNGSSTLTVDADNIYYESTTSEYPIQYIKNVNDDSLSGRIRFIKDSTSPADLDVLGYFDFAGDDSAGTETTFARWICYSEEVNDTDEAGTCDFQLLFDDGTPALDSFIKIVGDNGTPGQGYVALNNGQQDVDTYIYGADVAVATIDAVNNVFEINANLVVETTAITGTDTIGLDDRKSSYLVTTDTGGFEITLETALLAVPGYTVTFQDEAGTASGTDPITIKGEAAENLNGGASLVIDAAYGWVTCQPNTAGTAWICRGVY